MEPTMSDEVVAAGARVGRWRSESKEVIFFSIATFVVGLALNPKRLEHVASCNAVEDPC